MSYIRVIYTANRIHDYVSCYYLDTLMAENRITHFYRPSEKCWVNIRTDPIRGRGGYYQGPERRRDEKEATSNWIENLCQAIENA